jgi:hydroxyacylglutathione hydrolase
MKLTENLYAYVWKGNDNNCNSYIFANTLKDNKHILIDPGHIITPYLHEHAFEILNKEIEKDGLKSEDIGLILLTHPHPDHFESALKFQELYKAQVGIHKDALNMYQNFDGNKIDLILKEGDLVSKDLIKDKIELIYTPGHAPGEISIYWPSQKALAAGDVVFFQNTGRCDLPGGDPSLLKKSIETLSKLDLEFLLCGHPYGHPGVIQGKETIKKNFSFILNNFFD